MPDYIYLLEHRLSPPQRSALKQVRDTARDAGMTVFLAGGAVRDLTSGSSVRDLDFTVQGNALNLLNPLEELGAVLWGEHEPSRTVRLWFPGSVRVEISSARREEFPQPGKPVYEWATIHDDLRRRDFTANAMALSLNESSYGLLLDPLNGVADIEARLLRLASNYGFLDDPSRLVRGWRLHHRLGWAFEERTLARYQNARSEGVISAISPYLLGVELEAIAHEEDGFQALKALEAEGWMKHLCPAWTSAKADAQGLAALQQTITQLQIQGVNPSGSAAQMELLTAKMQPKDRVSLKKALADPGFVAQWERLEPDAKEFAHLLTSREASSPSAIWKLLTTYQAEPVLWLAFSSKSAPIQAKFKNFFTVWPEAKQRIPLSLLLEMRITPDLPGYEDLLQEMFFRLIDGHLQTEDEIRAFLEPYSPPAPPPPVSVRRPRGRRAERARIEEEDEEMEHEGPDAHDDDLDEEGDDSHDDISSQSDKDLVEEVRELPRRTPAPPVIAPPVAVPPLREPAPAAIAAPVPATVPEPPKAKKHGPEIKKAAAGSRQAPVKGAPKKAVIPAASDVPKPAVGNTTKAIPKEKTAAAKSPQKTAPVKAKPAKKPASPPSKAVKGPSAKVGSRTTAKTGTKSAKAVPKKKLSVKPKSR